MLNLEKSAAAFAEAKKLMPGGVNSPVRSYRNVDCNPPFIERAEGSHIFDIDGAGVADGNSRAPLGKAGEIRRELDENAVVLDTADYPGDGAADGERSGVLLPSS